MNSFAALMVIIACHSDGSGCINEPVAVISYHTSGDCLAAMPQEVKKVQRLAKVVYGDCVPVDPALLAGKPEIRRSMDPQRLAAALSGTPTRATAFAESAVASGPLFQR
jgi:hypothetical protein